MRDLSSEVAMNVSRVGVMLLLAVLIVFGTGRPALAVEVSRHPDTCRILASTGKSEAGREPEVERESEDEREKESRRTCARVDNRLPAHVLRAPEKKRERPIDRLRSRGEGTLKVSGDKGARRQLNLESPSRR
jgi:hypothetical protein